MYCIVLYCIAYDTNNDVLRWELKNVSLEFHTQPSSIRIQNQSIYHSQSTIKHQTNCTIYFTVHRQQSHSITVDFENILNLNSILNLGIEDRSNV